MDDVVLHGLKEIARELGISSTRAKAWAQRKFAPIAWTDDGNGRRYFALRSALQRFIAQIGRVPTTS
jgi:hypothetical protein